MGSKQKDSGIEKDENLVAVIIADDFDEKFTILTENKPKCLLKLANKEMIDYTLEFLQSCKVQDCYVYSAKFIKQIKGHLLEKQWLSSSPNQQQTRRNKMNVSVIANENCHSFGDAMRDLDEKGILRDHFILTSADMISNANIEPFIQEHRRRYQENKNTTLTLVYKHADPGHQSRSKDEEVLLLLKTESNRIVYHARATDAFQDRSKKKNAVQFPIELFQGNSNDTLNVRFDLVDTGIAICAPSVPLEFAERFDCQTLDDFIKGSIEDDIADHFLYASVLGDNEHGNACSGYASKIADFHTYRSVNTDILNRWAYPLVPEAIRTTTGQKLYSMSRHNVYKANNVTLKKGSVLHEDVIVGQNTLVGENSTLFKVSVGNSCKLNENVSIRDSIIHDNVVIGANCQLKGCIIGQDAIIGANVVIHEKSIIGPGAHIKDNCNPIGPLTWIVSKKEDDGFDDDIESNETEESDLGPKAFLYRQEEDSDSDADAEDHKNTSKEGLEQTWGLLVPSENDDDDCSSTSSEESDGFPLADDPVQDIINDADAKFRQFHDEVFESLQRGYEDHTEDGNLVLEVNASRHAYAVTATQVVRSVVMSVFAIASSTAEEIDTTSNTLFAEVKQKLNFFQKLIQRYVKSESSEFDCMKGIEMYCWQNNDFLNVSSKVIHFMYDKMELLSEESILAWYENEDDDDDELITSANKTVSEKLKQKLKPFIDWLEKSDESEEDD